MTTMNENYKYILIEVEMSTGTIHRGFVVPQKGSEGMTISTQVGLQRNSVIGMFADDKGFLLIHPAYADTEDDIIILNREYIASVHLAVDL